jgi:large subunit ribosomal protein L17
MRHRSKKVQLDRNARQRKPLLRNLAVSLITTEKIVTTDAKGRWVKAFVERLITKGKANTLHARRQIIAALNDPKAAEKVLTVLSPRFAKRAGGYSRSIKLTPRHGDAAERVVIELLNE